MSDAPIADPEGLASGTPLAPTRAEAIAFWLKLGCISFGGPAGQIALMHEELVERRRWISENRFLHALNYCMVLPGPEAQQLATYIGWLLHRTWGGVVAGALFVLPSLVLLIALSWVYMAWGQLPAVTGLFYGIKPAVTALVMQAAWRVGSRALRNAWLWAIAAAAFLALFAFSVPFPLIVGGAALLGWIGGRIAPDRFRAGGHGAQQGRGAPALIDDDTPIPEHARFRWSRVRRLLLVFGLLWAGVMGLLMAWLGPQAVLTRMSLFFSQAALLTFGGAYAVLPYVVQGAVEQQHWLTAPQMIDGLALGETTPGPLIMVVSFVGFVGAWTHQAFGPDALALAGIAGAALVTWFTFLPSFAFILLGGPFIETTHGKLGFTAPLTAITAAVVGVILNLALFFAVQVLLNRGGFDGMAALIGLGAGVALFRFKVGVIPVVLGCGLAGLALRLAGIA